MLHDERGDTIVEVLIAAAIISLVLVSSFAITNRSSRSILGNQERTQAQRIAESQIEALRVNNGITTSGDCFNGVAETGTCGSFTTSGSGATYEAKITGPTGAPVVGGTYTVTVRWTSIGSKTDNDSTLGLVYRLK